MKFVSSSIGNQISAELYGVDEVLLNDTDFLERVVLEGLEKDDFNILGKLDHKFIPRGYTLTVLLAESHLAIHTYPEHRSVYFELYSCKGRDHGRNTFDHFVEMLKPRGTVIRSNTVIVRNETYIRD